MTLKVLPFGSEADAERWLSWEPQVGEVVTVVALVPDAGTDGSWRTGDPAVIHSIEEEVGGASRIFVNVATTVSPIFFYKAHLRPVQFIGPAHG